MLRFLLVGVVNTLVGAGIMFLLYNLAGCSYWLSSAANYIVGGVVSYFLNKYYTFKNTERSWKQVLRFALNVAVCWLLAYGIAKPLACWGLLLIRSKISAFHSARASTRSSRPTPQCWRDCVSTPRSTTLANASSRSGQRRTDPCLNGSPAR